MVSQDGGVSFVRKRWDGNASDSRGFQARAEALLSAVKTTTSPRSLVADATRSHEDHAAYLAKRGCITRIPATLKLVSQVINPALQWDTWQPLDDHTRYPPLALCHDGMAQRGLVGSSQAALARAEATRNKAKQREQEAIDTQLLHLQATRFSTPQAAQEALAALAKRWTYHRVESSHLSAHQRSAGTGRPTACTPLKAIAWPIQAHIRADEERMAYQKQGKACCVLGTNSAASALRDVEVIAAYKGQSHVAGGLRFLKDPRFFVSSLFVKKPNRLEGLLMVMPLALLVDSVAQRRLRKQ